MKKGDRVGAIQSATDQEVIFFGYGVYDGDIDHPELGFPNPRITLDNGRIVWGCECWWGAESKIKEMIGDRKVTDVSPDRNPEAAQAR